MFKIPVQNMMYYSALINSPLFSSVVVAIATLVQFCERPLEVSGALPTHEHRPLSVA